MPATQTELELRAVKLELPPDTHKRLRLAAAELDTSLTALARRAVEEFLSRRDSGKK